MDALNLRKYRKQFKLNQFQVAELLNITQQAYSCWENGKSFPNSNQILQLCDIFKCTPNDLFGFKGVHAVVGAKIRGE